MMRKLLNNGHLLILAVFFFGVATALFLVSGVRDWWELRQHGVEVLAQVADLDYTPIGSTRTGADGLDRLTVTFTDSAGSYRKIRISDWGRYALEHGINSHNPGPSLPKQAWIVYSARNPEGAELRDYRRHSWWMFGASVLFALCYPVIVWFSRRMEREPA